LNLDRTHAEVSTPVSGVLTLSTLTMLAPFGSYNIVGAFMSSLSRADRHEHSLTLRAITCFHQNIPEPPVLPGSAINVTNAHS
jgi:hypothetical protein